MDKMNEGPPSHTSPPYIPPPVEPPPYPQPPPPLQQHTVIIQGGFGKDPQHIICPYCHADISTRVETEASTKTHLIALVLCLLCCCLAPIPYCVDSCQAQKHFCPACKAYLGSYNN